MDSDSQHILVKHHDEVSSMAIHVSKEAVSRTPSTLEDPRDYTAIHEIIENRETSRGCRVKEVSKIGLQLSNFLSDVSKHVVKGTDTSNKEYSRTFVAKSPPTSAEYNSIYGCDVAFKNEQIAYKSILPNLQKYSPRPIPTPECIHASSDVIIMEDLETRGYHVINKLTGFTEEVIRLILTELANLHAASFLMQHRNPELFSQISNQVEEIVYKAEGNTVLLSTQERMVEVAVQLAIDRQEDAKYINAVKALIGKSEDVQKQLLRLRRKPFAVINHGDLWCNNFLLRTSDDLASDDFQMMRYTSLAADLCYFFYVNLEPNLRRNHQDAFLEFYLRELTDHLAPHKIPQMQELTIESLKEEMHNYAVFGFLCGLWVLPIFYNDIKIVKKTKEIFEQYNTQTVDDILSNMIEPWRNRLLRLLKLYVDTSKNDILTFSPL